MLRVVRGGANVQRQALLLVKVPLHAGLEHEVNGARDVGRVHAIVVRIVSVARLQRDEEGHEAGFGDGKVPHQARDAEAVEHHDSKAVARRLGIQAERVPLAQLPASGKDAGDGWILDGCDDRGELGGDNDAAPAGAAGAGWSGWWRRHIYRDAMRRQLQAGGTCSTQWGVGQGCRWAQPS